MGLSGARGRAPLRVWGKGGGRTGATPQLRGQKNAEAATPPSQTTPQSPAGAGLWAGSGHPHLPSTANAFDSSGGRSLGCCPLALAEGSAPRCLMAWDRQQLCRAAGYPQVNPSEGNSYSPTP